MARFYVETDVRIKCLVEVEEIGKAQLLIERELENLVFDSVDTIGIIETEEEDTTFTSIVTINVDRDDAELTVDMLLATGWNSFFTDDGNDTILYEHVDGRDTGIIALNII